MQKYHILNALITQGTQLFCSPPPSDAARCFRCVPRHTLLCPSVFCITHMGVLPPVFAHVPPSQSLVWPPLSAPRARGPTGRRRSRFGLANRRFFRAKVTVPRSPRFCLVHDTGDSASTPLTRARFGRSGTFSDIRYAREVGSSASVRPFSAVSACRAR